MPEDKTPDHHKHAWWMLYDITREYAHDHPIPWEIGQIELEPGGEKGKVVIVGPELDKDGKETGHKERHTYTAQVERVEEEG